MRWIDRQSETLKEWKFMRKITNERKKNKNKYIERSITRTADPNFKLYVN